ncbi:MAG: thioredoxin domain-containing protein [Nanoarchaeota archaeon]|nr:thioredoxin domain-containing protein [Nanoarchaeota archaeon]
MNEIKSKTYLLIFVLLLMIGGSYAILSFNNIKSKPSNDVLDGSIETSYLKVRGMTCPTCVTTIKKALLSEEGIKEININLEAETAEVKYISGLINPEDIISLKIFTSYYDAEILLEEEFNKFQIKPVFKAEDFVDSSDPILGSKDATTLIVFEDFNCKECKEFNEKIKPKIIKEFVDNGKLRYVFKDFAPNPDSINLALAARCAQQQNKFWEYHKLLFKNQDKENFGSKENLVSYADEIGIDIEKFENCIINREYVFEIVNNLKTAEKIGINASSFFVNGKVESIKRMSLYYEHIIEDAIAGFGDEHEH